MSTELVYSTDDEKDATPGTIRNLRIVTVEEHKKPSTKPHQKEKASTKLKAVPETTPPPAEAPTPTPVEAAPEPVVVAATVRTDATPQTTSESTATVAAPAKKGKKAKKPTQAKAETGPDRTQASDHRRRIEALKVGRIEMQQWFGNDLRLFTIELKQTDPRAAQLLIRDIDALLQFFRGKLKYSLERTLCLLEQGYPEIMGQLADYVAAKEAKIDELEARRLQIREDHGPLLSILHGGAAAVVAQTVRESLKEMKIDRIQHLIGVAERALSRKSAEEAKIDELEARRLKIHEDHGPLVKTLEGAPAVTVGRSVRESLETTAIVDIVRHITVAELQLDKKSQPFVSGGPSTKRRKRGKTPGQIARADDERRKRAALPNRSNDSAKGKGGKKK